MTTYDYRTAAKDKSPGEILNDVVAVRDQLLSLEHHLRDSGDVASRKKTMSAVKKALELMTLVRGIKDPGDTK